jgi:hypothetical protein
VIFLAAASAPVARHSGIHLNLGNLRRFRIWCSSSLLTIYWRGFHVPFLPFTGETEDTTFGLGALVGAVR